MDAMLAAKREKPLTIAGPRQTTQRMKSMATALMPGMHVMTPKFLVTYLDMETMLDHEIGCLKVRTFPALHTKETNPTSLRVEVARQDNRLHRRQRMDRAHASVGRRRRSSHCGMLFLQQARPAYVAYNDHEIGRYFNHRERPCSSGRLPHRASRLGLNWQ
jgi:hypothetical protein